MNVQTDGATTSQCLSDGVPTSPELLQLIEDIAFAVMRDRPKEEQIHEYLANYFDKQASERVDAVEQTEEFHTPTGSDAGLAQPSQAAIMQLAASYSRYENDLIEITSESIIHHGGDPLSTMKSVGATSAAAVASHEAFKTPTASEPEIVPVSTVQSSEAISPLELELRRREQEYGTPTPSMHGLSQGSHMKLAESISAVDRASHRDREVGTPSPSMPGILNASSMEFAESLISMSSKKDIAKNNSGDSETIVILHPVQSQRPSSGVQRRLKYRSVGQDRASQRNLGWEYPPAEPLFNGYTPNFWGCIRRNLNIIGHVVTGQCAIYRAPLHAILAGGITFAAFMAISAFVKYIDCQFF